MKNENIIVDCPNCPQGHPSWQEYADCLIADSQPQENKEFVENLVEALREAIEFNKGKKKLRTTTKTLKKKKRKKK